MALEIDPVEAAPMKNEFATATESGMSKLIDRVLDLVLHKLKEKNQAIPIKDVLVKFKTTFLCLPIKAEIELQNGKLWGIDTITRSDDVDFEYNDPVADLKSDLIMANLKFTFDFQFVINRRIYKGNITGNITRLDLSFGLKMNFNDEELEISGIELNNIEKLKIDIISHEFAAKLMNYFLCIITTTSRLAILCITENQLQRFLGQKLPI